ncbi:MOSC domain protein beta barrel domain protein [Thalassoporum mexicanum PCC 7367]|uniref:MOSC domain-containing protein n=1 Tax=Thalassoporum mexicanum TaxID=3457544 RepID=UPI00029FE7D5|nr:MOSC N-terminal beta barrel domain-containing protein [Pseudanabaena sp. PCC 7367]AFY69099.1 MOSC domain protein beta barrel domain protein [Pseudanabaena sp. PCC 7367]
MPHLASIHIFPIKALDGVIVSEAQIQTGGSLVGDRQFAIFDSKGKYVNGKNNQQVHQIRASYDLSNRQVELSRQDGGNRARFNLEGDRQALVNWLSDYFGFAVTLQENLSTGFPDDKKSTGPTIISTATIAKMTEWFPELDQNQLRLRFRTNLEIADILPFWEEQLYGEVTQLVRFKIGTVEFVGTNPCQRCIVPTRDPLTGESYAGFQKTFLQKRTETLPDWATRSRFNHFYRLAINTNIAAPTEAGKVLRVGDPVEILETCSVDNVDN